MDEKHNLIVQLLKNSLREPEQLSEYIKKIQDFAWNEDLLNTDTREIVAELAYDLDFFEPDPATRKEDASFLDREQALTEIRNALAKLENIGDA